MIQFLFVTAWLIPTIDLVSVSLVLRICFASWGWGCGGPDRIMLPCLWVTLAIVDDLRLSSTFLMLTSKLFSFDLDACNSLMNRLYICFANLFIASSRLLKHPRRLVPGPNGGTFSTSFLYIRSNPPTCYSSPVKLRLVNCLQPLHIDNCENIIDESTFENTVSRCVSSHWRTAINFDDPWSESRVEHNIEAIKLEAVFVVRHEFLNTFEGLNDEGLDAVKTLLNSFGPVSAYFQNYCTLRAGTLAVCRLATCLPTPGCTHLSSSG